MSDRLASSVLVGALIRLAEAEGGFAAVLAKGDATSGSILVILIERGSNPAVYERLLEGDGCYRWRRSAQNIEKQAEVPVLIAGRRHFDPDLWAIELDIPSAERFAAGMNALC
jgi:hypothetical protein